MAAHLDAEDQPDAVEPDLGQEPLEPGAARGGLAAAALVLVDDDDPVRRPAEGQGAAVEVVLQVLDSRCSCTCWGLDWRTVVIASRSRCRAWTLPSRRGGRPIGSLCRGSPGQADVRVRTSWVFMRHLRLRWRCRQPLGHHSAEHVERVVTGLGRQFSPEPGS